MPTLQLSHHVNTGSCACERKWHRTFRIWQEIHNRLLQVRALGPELDGEDETKKCRESGPSRPLEPGQVLTFSSYRRCIGDGAAQSPRDECSWLSIAVIHERLVRWKEIDQEQSTTHGTDRRAEQKLRPCGFRHVFRRFRDHGSASISSRGDPDRH